MNKNYEYGCVVSNEEGVNECQAYFDDLWNRSGSSLTNKQLDQWEEEIQTARANQQPSSYFENEDEGVDIGIAQEPEIPLRFTDAPSGYVKFFGSANSRVDREQSVLEELEVSGGHWACTYPENKRPVSVDNGACMFMARMVKDPNDFIIFGRATGMKHVRGRDEASPSDISLRDWKKSYPLYLRVHSGEFLSGTLRNGISLFKLFDDLGAESLAPTSRHQKSGEGNIDPRKSVRQQAHVHLTPAACDELNRRLQSAFDRYGVISKTEIGELDKPSTPANALSDDVLPISLDPSDVQEFKRLLLVHKQAKIRILFEDGNVESNDWNASRFTESSDVIGNLRSRPRFRSGNWQKEGISKVFVNIVESS